MRKILICSCIVTMSVLLGVSCEKADDACVEKLKEDCACTKDYTPVCGCNGKTYGNACMAECSGITDYTAGACE